jgi:hypothetical protein
MQSAFRETWSLSVLSGALKRRFSVATATLAFVLVVCGAIVVLQISHLLEQRAKALADGKRDTANLVTSLVQHANLTFGRQTHCCWALLSGRSMMVSKVVWRAKD